MLDEYKFTAIQSSSKDVYFSMFLKVFLVLKGLSKGVHFSFNEIIYALYSFFKIVQPYKTYGLI